MALAACAVCFLTSAEFINTDKLYFMIVQNGFISLKSLQQSHVCGSNYTSMWTLMAQASHLASLAHCTGPGTSNREILTD